MKKYILTGLILMSCFVVLSGCGGGAVDAPEGTVITVDPSSVTLSNTALGVGVPTQFTVTVRDANGVPLNDVIVYISSSHAIPSGSSIQLYDSNGVETDSPMNVGTDKNGVYNLDTDIYGDDYTAQLEFRSGSAYEVVPISVSLSEGG